MGYHLVAVVARVFGRADPANRTKARGSHKSRAFARAGPPEAAARWVDQTAGVRGVVGLTAGVRGAVGLTGVSAAVSGSAAAERV
jgi:hypothetical protein